VIEHCALIRNSDAFTFRFFAFFSGYPVLSDTFVYLARPLALFELHTIAFSGDFRTKRGFCLCKNRGHVCTHRRYAEREHNRQSSNF